MDSQPTNTNGKRLMIVDDDFEMRTLLAEYFRRLGFEVAEKESAAAALQTVTTDSFDCFILDISMPEMSGIELLRKLRDRGIDTPALFLTAHDMLDDKVAGFEAGADDYLAKPFSPRELIARIAAVLRRTQALPPRQKPPEAERIRFGDWMLDTGQREVIGRVAVPAILRRVIRAVRHRVPRFPCAARAGRAAVAVRWRRT